MFLAHRRHQSCDANQLPTGDDIYVRAGCVDLTTLGPLEKLFLLPDGNDPAIDHPVGKIWTQGHDICVLSPLGYNVSVQSGAMTEVWVEYPTIHITATPDWHVIVESNGIDCHRKLPLMAPGDQA
jgi:hypothetical protein